MKNDLKDVTFNIPVRYDTDDRIENLNLIVDYILHHFDTNIIVMEEDSSQKFESIAEKVEYHFIQTDDPNLHRTKRLNDMAKMSDTPIIVNYDTDVLFPVSNYIEATNLIRNIQAQMVFPYAGKFLECPRTHISKIRENMSVDYLKNTQLHCNHPESVGGCIFWDKNTFIEIGMENENFKSWGWEDNERISRARKLDISIARTSGDLYHITHQRLADSTPRNVHYNQNQQQFNIINRMTKSQLQKHIKTWDWVK